MGTKKEGGGYGAASPELRRVLDLTLRGVHHIRIDSIPDGDAALRLEIENVETGDKFGRTVFPRELPCLVPEKLKTDVESLDDLEFLLVEGLTAEQAAGDGVAVRAGEEHDEQPAVLAASKECAAAADGQLTQRFTIHLRVWKGILGRQKMHTLELLVPVTAVATKDDAIRIMFRKLKENFERTNADLRKEVDLLRLQSNNRVLFGVAHSVSRFATALKTCTVAVVQDDMFKPVPKTEVGTFRPAARAGSVFTVVPSPAKPGRSVCDDRNPDYFVENWVKGHVDWTPEVKLTGGCFEAHDDGALVVKRAGLYEVHYMFDCSGPNGEGCPTAPWTHQETSALHGGDAKAVYCSRPGKFLGSSNSGIHYWAWLPPNGRGVVRSSTWGTYQGDGTIINRLSCGCVLYGRIKIEQGDDRAKPETHGRIYHLEPGDRIEMQFWLHLALAGNGTEITCKLGGGGTKEHSVQLDDQKEQNQDCVQKRLFDTAPWLKFTLVADKPESDHDVGHVPLRADQLPELSADELLPLQLCTNLSSLHVKGGPGAELSHLRFLHGLTNLRELVIVDACASDLAPLGELTKLTKLHITGLQLGAGSAVSIEPLSSLQALSELSLYGSASIIDGVPLGKLVSLKGLDLTASGIVNRTPLQQPGLVIHAA